MAMVPSTVRLVEWRAVTVLGARVVERCTELARVLEVEQVAKDEPGLLATVGRLAAYPGASNVVIMDLAG